MLHSAFVHIRLFILKALGLTTQEEEKELTRMVRENPKFGPLLRSLEDSDYYAKRRQLLKELDTEKELAAFLKQHRNHRVRHYWQAAAAILFLLGGSTVYLLNNSREPIASSYTAATYNNRQGAVLILSDGSTQILDGHTEPIVETNGSRILRDSAQLNYSGTVVDRTEQPIYNQLSVGRGFEYMLTLHDGTKVWMNSGSKLEYPVTFNASVRRVKLSGEAYFEVTRDSTCPFIVEVNGLFDVKVLGTSFNIKAYPGDEQAETTLVEGKVAIGEMVLQPSEQAVFRNNQVVEIRKVNVNNYLAWHEGWFYFENERLEQALEQVGRWYDVHFRFGDEESRNQRVTGKIKRFENLTVILDMLSTISGCQFNREDQNIYVTK